MAYFPMFVDLSDKPCLVIGGGNVAYRKVKVLLDFDARIKVVAEDICDELRHLAADDKEAITRTGIDTAGRECSHVYQNTSDRIEIIKRRFEKKDCVGMKMVIAATDDKILNHNIAEYCKSKNIMVNAVDQKEDCSFIFSSYVKEKNLVAAFSSGGNSPVLTQYLKSKEKEILTPFLGELNEYMGQIRESVIAEYDTEEERKRVFKEIVCKAIDNNKF